MITKFELEELALQYETESFIKDDPIQFPHRFNIMTQKNPKNDSFLRVFKSDRGSARTSISNGIADDMGSNRTKEVTKKIPDFSANSIEKDIEIAAFIASIFAYGNRKVFIKKLDELFDIMQNKPFEYVLNFEPESLKGFNYRFAKDFDIIEIFRILNKLYSKDGGLKKLFEYGYKQRDIQTMFQVVTDYFYSNAGESAGKGFYFMIPNPKNGGAMKRMNMFLRWMVRKGKVDLGLWDFIPQSELLIPLDVHVARLSREMGLLKRNSNDFKAVLELSKNLKQINPNDPIKFDFAIFGLGINR